MNVRRGEKGKESADKRTMTNNSTIKVSNYQIVQAFLIICRMKKGKSKNRGNRRVDMKLGRNEASSGIINVFNDCNFSPKKKIVAQRPGLI